MAPAAKRRRTDPQPEEITFDPAARQEYLSGFHKRKQQRIQNARDTAAKLAKEERVRDRKQLREQRKEDREQHVMEVNAALKKLERDVGDSSDSESGAEDAEGDKGGQWEGIAEIDQAKVIPDDEEYVDEDKYTTVTVEAMDGEADESQDHEDEGLVESKAVKTVNGDGRAKSTLKKRKSSKDTKPKKKKFRYETKTERRATRDKQKTKNHKAKLRREGK